MTDNKRKQENQGGALGWRLMEEEEYKEAITSMQVPHLLWTHMLRVNTLNQF